MAFSTLEAIPDSAAVFVDAPIFIYHFTGTSESCREFLARCEMGELRGVTSAVTLAEVTHRLMMIEAVKLRGVSPGNVPAKLRKRPKLVRELQVHQEQVEKIPLMGIDVEPLDLRTLLHAGEARRRDGLLTNDSLAAATARLLELPRIASADADFGSLEGLVLHRPTDLQ